MAKKNIFKFHRNYFYFLTGLAVGTLIVSVIILGQVIRLPKVHPVNLINLIASPTPLPTPTMVPTPTPSPLPQPVKLPIVMYHYVEYVQDKGDIVRQKLDINPFLFNLHMKELKDNNYQTYFVKDIPSIMKGEDKLASKSIVLTFDDGYEDFYINAYPVLKKYDFKATIYIIANYINRKGFLTDKEISEMLSSGLIEVGAHTLNHLDLKTIPLDKAKKEIFDSKQILESTFNIKVETFAYPGGRYNDAVVNLVKEASYSAAVSTNPGVELKSEQMFVLPRIRAGYIVPSVIQQFFDKFKI